MLETSRPFQSPTWTQEQVQLGLSWAFILAFSKTHSFISFTVNLN